MGAERPSPTRPPATRPPHLSTRGALKTRGGADRPSPTRGALKTEGVPKWTRQPPHFFLFFYLSEYDKKRHCNDATLVRTDELCGEKVGGGLVS